MSFLAAFAAFWLLQIVVVGFALTACFVSSLMRETGIVRRLLLRSAVPHGLPESQ